MPNVLNVVDPRFHGTVDLTPARTVDAGHRISEQIIDFVTVTVMGDESRNAVVNKGAVPAPVDEDKRLGRPLDSGDANGGNEHEQNDEQRTSHSEGHRQLRACGAPCVLSTQA